MSNSAPKRFKSLTYQTELGWLEDTPCTIETDANGLLKGHRKPNPQFGQYVANGLFLVRHESKTQSLDDDPKFKVLCTQGLYSLVFAAVGPHLFGVHNVEHCTGIANRAKNEYDFVHAYSLVLRTFDCSVPAIAYNALYEKHNAQRVWLVLRLHPLKLVKCFRPEERKSLIEAYTKTPCKVNSACGLSTTTFGGALSELLPDIGTKHFFVSHLCSQRGLTKMTPVPSCLPPTLRMVENINPELCILYSDTDKTEEKVQDPLDAPLSCIQLQVLSDSVEDISFKVGYEPYTFAAITCLFIQHDGVYVKTTTLSVTEPADVQRILLLCQKDAMSSEFVFNCQDEDAAEAFAVALRNCIPIVQPICTGGYVVTVVGDYTLISRVLKQVKCTADI